MSVYTTHSHYLVSIQTYIYTACADTNYHINYSYVRNILTHLCYASRTLSYPCFASLILTHPSESNENIFLHIYLILSLKTTVQWCNGAMVLWCYGEMVLWWNCDVIPWWNVKMVKHSNIEMVKCCCDSTIHG